MFPQIFAPCFTEAFRFFKVNFKTKAKSENPRKIDVFKVLQSIITAQAAITGMDGK